MSRVVQYDSDHDSVTVEVELFSNHQNRTMYQTRKTKIKFLQRAVFYLTEARKRATQRASGVHSSFKWKTSYLCSGPSRCINDPKLTLQWENTATHLACSIIASSIQALLNCRKTLRVKIASNKYTRQTIFFLPRDMQKRHFKSGWSDALFNEWRWVHVSSLHDWTDPIKEKTLVL